MHEDRRADIIERIGAKRGTQLVVAGMCLTLVVAYCIHHASDLQTLHRLDPLDVATFFLLAALANLIGAYKLFLMLNWLGLKQIGFLKWLGIFVGSRFANFYVTQGANVYRAVKLKREHALSYSESVGLTGVITCLDTASVLFVTGLLILVGGRFQPSAGLLILASAFVAVSPLVILPYVVRRFAPSDAPQRPAWLAWAGNRTRVLSEVLARCTRDVQTIGFISGMTILVYLAVLASTAVCLTAFGGHVSMFNAALLTSVLMLSRAINIVPGNLGVSEFLAGVSTSVLMDQAMYGVMIAAIFRIVDFMVIGIAFLVLTIRPRATTNHHSIE